MVGNVIGIIFGGAFLGYLFAMILFSIAFLLLMIIAEIKYPNTTKHTSVPTRSGLHYVAQKGKEKENNAKEKFLESVFGPLFKIFSILGVIIGIVVLYIEVM